MTCDSFTNLLGHGLAESTPPVTHTTFSRSSSRHDLYTHFAICYNVATLSQLNTVVRIISVCSYRGADKSLAPPGRKQATATDDFGVHISYLLS